MGGFKKCLHKECNLTKDKIFDDEDDDSSQEEKEFDELSDINDVSLRHKTEVNSNYFCEKNSNIEHYDENYLDFNGELKRTKKSHSVFVKNPQKYNI